MKIMVAKPACSATEPEDGAGPPGMVNSSVTAGLRARLNNCWSIVSKSQPSEATMKTNHWYRVSSFHQGPSLMLAERLAAVVSSKCIWDGSNG